MCLELQWRSRKVSYIMSTPVKQSENVTLQNFPFHVVTGLTVFFHSRIFRQKTNLFWHRTTTRRWQPGRDTPATTTGWTNSTELKKIPPKYFFSAGMTNGQNFSTVHLQSANGSTRAKKKSFTILKLLLGFFFFRSQTASTFLCKNFRQTF
jgi:hypothetical protein